MPALGFDAEAAATALLAARSAKEPMAGLPAATAPRSELEGVAVQVALARRLGAFPPAGFKIGATAKVMQDYLGLSGPAAGFMPEAGILGSGATVASHGFLRPGVECEIAVRLGRGLPPGPCTPEQAEAAVAEVFPAIEIVEQRYTDLVAFGTPSLIADQVFHAAAVLGASLADWSAIDLGLLRGRIVVNGDERASGVGGDLLGHPMRALAWLASSNVSAGFGGLRAGQVILLGSVTPPIWLEGTAEISVEFPPFAPVKLTLV
jgi:2-keto-4-pentenoate hydratase